MPRSIVPQPHQPEAQAREGAPHQPEAQAREAPHPRSRFGLVWGAICLSLWTAAAFAHEGAPPPAKVTVVGKEAAILTVDGPAGKTQYVVLEIEGGATIKVKTNQDIAALNDQLLRSHRKLGSEFTEHVKLLVNKNDMGGIKKAEQDFKSASDDLLEHLSIYAAEGTLRLVDGHIEMDGQLRLPAFNGADTALGKGKVRVVGNPISVKDKEGRSHLAVQNGNYPILVNDKLSESPKGPIAVHGVLRVTPKGNALSIDPDY